MKGKRVFVSGGAGVIGTVLVKKLHAVGARVFVGDLKSRPQDFPREVLYRQGDLLDLRLQELQAFKPEIFIHLAATFERSTESYTFWEENFHHNVRLSHHLMSLVKGIEHIERVVFASSYLVYDPKLYQFDEPQDCPVELNEHMELNPRNLTGMAKLSHEMELSFLQQFRGEQFTTVAARIFRGYGRNSRDVISRWIRALLRDEPIDVYRPEGLFDYIYADDSAEGLLRLAQTSYLTGVINLGTGQARRVSDIVEILGKHFPDMQANDIDIDIPFEASQGNIDNLIDATGWSPRYSLEAAIREIIDHERVLLTAKETATAPVSLLVTSASKKVPLLCAAEQAVRRLGPGGSVTAADTSTKALAAMVSSDFWCMPPTSDEHVDEILAGCLTRGINTILPTRDGELAFWAKHSPIFEASGVKVIVSSPEAVERCVDKLLFAEFGHAEGLPVIPASTDLASLTGGRYVVKERFGAGSQGIGLNLSWQEALDCAVSLEYPVFMPFIRGREFTVDAWVGSNHRVKGLVLRWRDQVVDGESQMTTTFRDQNLEAEAERTIEALGLEGPVVLQALVDDAGRMHVIECNARFGGASTTGIAAGVDSLFWSVLAATGAQLDDYPFLRLSGEIRQIRVPADILSYDSDI